MRDTKKGSGTVNTPRNNNITLRSDQLPIISFVVVNYNYGKFLEDCIESVYAQTYERIEVLS
jgi:cellulose synthase/poly-beta-1,6-N-acetylglucosamine synthase-like glycosyltransferase